MWKVVKRTLEYRGEIFFLDILTEFDENNNRISSSLDDKIVSDIVYSEYRYRMQILKADEIQRIVDNTSLSWGKIAERCRMTEHHLAEIINGHIVQTIEEDKRIRQFRRDLIHLECE